jgi:small conductance mechanosensitive channel
LKALNKGHPAAAGIAIGAAWSGLLSNFAAGIFRVILRPFKIDDYVSAGGMVGTVMAIGLFGTSINTTDNFQTMIGNAKIFPDNDPEFFHQRVSAGGSGGTAGPYGRPQCGDWIA